MRIEFSSLLLVTVCLAGQDTATHNSWSLDANGHRVDGIQIIATKSKTHAEHTERLRSINGHMVPLEKIDELVIRDDSSGRTVQRTVQRYDPDGHPSPPETTLIEQVNQSGGKAVIRATTSTRDLNGNFQLVARSVTETQKSSGTESAETTIEKTSIDGSLQPVEKRSVLKRESEGRVSKSATTYQRGVNGFFEAQREVSETRKNATGATTETAVYEVGSTGTAQLSSQTMQQVFKHPDGSETEVVDRFGRYIPGNVISSGPALQLQERATLERATAADGSIHESYRVQEPTLSDPNKLGVPRLVYEAVCKGKCVE